MIAYATVTKYLRQWQFPTIPYDAGQEPPTTIVENATLDMIDKQPFSSIRDLAKPMCIPKTTITRHFT
jgi:hypothetical protein